MTVDDVRLQRALAVFAEAHAGAPGLVLRSESGLAAAIASVFGDEITLETSAVEADVARAAVELLLEDQNYGPEMRALLAGPAPERFGLIETAAVITAALVVLQTHVRIERKPDGRWSILLLKKPTSTPLLSKLVSKLLPFLAKP